MTAMSMGQQGEPFESVEESIKIEKNSKGYNWSFRVKRESGESLDSWVAGCVILDNKLRDRFGTKD